VPRSGPGLGGRHFHLAGASFLRPCTGPIYPPTSGSKISNFHCEAIIQGLLPVVDTGVACSYPRKRDVLLWRHGLQMLSIHTTANVAHVVALHAGGNESVHPFVRETVSIGISPAHMKSSIPIVSPGALPDVAAAFNYLHLSREPRIIVTHALSHGLRGFCRRGGEIETSN
jgi:hypothetical protein